MKYKLTNITPGSTAPERVGEIYEKPQVGTHFVFIMGARYLKTTRVQTVEGDTFTTRNSVYRLEPVTNENAPV